MDNIFIQFDSTRVGQFKLPTLRVRKMTFRAKLFNLRELSCMVEEGNLMRRAIDAKVVCSLVNQTRQR
jgi:hypothetical protein